MKQSMKQSIWDWYKQNKDSLKTKNVFCNFNAGTITLKYPGFTWELRAEDFPNRNGEYEQDAIPGPSSEDTRRGQPDSSEVAGMSS